MSTITETPALPTTEDNAVAIVETLRLMLTELDQAMAVQWQQSPHPSPSLKNHTTSDPTPTVALDERRLELSSAISVASFAVLQAQKSLSEAGTQLTRALDHYNN